MTDQYKNFADDWYLSNVPGADHTRIRQELNDYANSELADDEIDWSWAKKYAKVQYMLVLNQHTEEEVDRWCSSGHFAQFLLDLPALNSILRADIESL